jgi:hypothetical protein
MRAFGIFVIGIFCTMLGMAGSFFAQNEFYLVEQNHAEQIAASIIGGNYDTDIGPKHVKRGTILRIVAIVFSWLAVGSFGCGSYEAMRAVTSVPTPKAIVLPYALPLVRAHP